MNRKYPLYILLCIIIGTIVSCKSSETEPVVSSSSVAVKTFTLSEDDSVVANLDSVFFTIDLNKREIYNADSLPKGTKITKLVPKITYPLVYSAMLHVKGGEVMKDSTINYATNSTDSIDFTGEVTLELVSEDQTQTATYRLKVNVHNMKPDSLYWNKMARRDLPGYTTPKEQKTVEFKNNVICLIKEANQFVISKISNPGIGSWTKQKIEFTFTPNLKSLTATDDMLYILSSENELYSSADGIDWKPCNARFVSLIGGYANRLLGVALDGGIYRHAEYSDSKFVLNNEIESGFPLRGTSTPIIFQSQWSTSMQMIIFGGNDIAGNAKGNTWGFDGTNWGLLNEKSAPAAISGAVLVPYFTYKVNSRWVATKYATLLAIGGFADGKPSRTVYVSYDYGVNWKKGDNLLQLPDYIPEFGNAQGIVAPVEMSARNSDAWVGYGSKKLPVWCSLMPQNQARGYELTWECPYIYLFGGTDAQGFLYDNIWRGVLNRLSFKPLI